MESIKLGVAGSFEDVNVLSTVVTVDCLPIVSKMDEIVEEEGFALVFNFFGLLLLSLAIEDKNPNPPEDDFFLVAVLTDLSISFLKSTEKKKVE